MRNASVTDDVLATARFAALAEVRFRLFPLSTVGAVDFAFMAFFILRADAAAWQGLYLRAAFCLAFPVTLLAVQFALHALLMRGYTRALVRWERRTFAGGRG